MPTIIGEIIKEKQITRAKMEEIKDKSNEKRRPVQDILMDDGFINEEDFVRIASMTYSGPVIDQVEEIIDPSCVELIPYSLAKRYSVFPIRRERQGFLLAMSNPHDLAALDDIRFVCELTPITALATKSQIADFIREYYIKKISVNDLLEKVMNATQQEMDEKDVSLCEENKDIDELDDQESDLLLFVNRIISDAVDARASDVHIEPQDESVNLRYRVDGYLKKVADIPRQLLDRIIARIKILAKLDIAEKRKFQDGRISIGMGGRKIDLRVSVTPVYYGEKAVVRILDTDKEMFELDKIGLHSDEKTILIEAITRPQGVVLVTGPTGSGKTTTIYSALQHIKDATRNIVTVEDPVEYLINGVNQIQLDRIKDITFANCLRSILRQDPDVIFVGEIRDKETAEVAFQSSLTGHLVFSSLHTNDSASSIVRLMDIGLEPYLIASSVNLIVSQRLVRVICPNCQETYFPDQWLIDKFKVHLDKVFFKKFLKGKGCRHCDFTGYRGRTTIFEMLNVDPKIKSLIHERASEAVIYQQAVQDGMKTLARSGVEKVAAGLTTLEELATVVDVKYAREDVNIFDLMYKKYMGLEKDNRFVSV